MLNLFNTAALAEQSSFHSSFSLTASAGCDGEVMMIDKFTSPYDWVFTKLAYSSNAATAINPQWWKITL
jgi:hypothetical protein